MKTQKENRDEGNVSSKNTTYDPLLQFFSFFYSVFTGKILQDSLILSKKIKEPSFIQRNEKLLCAPQHL